FITDLARMVRELQGWIEYRIEFPHHAQEVGLAAQQQSCCGSAGSPQRGKPQVLVVQHLLRLHQLGVELGQWQGGRQYRVLDIEQPIVARGQATLLSLPDLRSRIRCRHADVYHFRDLQAPPTYRFKAAAIPGGVSDDVDRHRDVE